MWNCCLAAAYWERDCWTFQYPPVSSHFVTLNCHIFSSYLLRRNTGYNGGHFQLLSYCTGSAIYSKGSFILHKGQLWWQHCKQSVHIMPYGTKPRIAESHVLMVHWCKQYISHVTKITTSKFFQNFFPPGWILVLQSFLHMSLNKEVPVRVCMSQ
jgi:hypothetical protein